MGSTLDAVLAYKAQKEAQQNADINAIPQAVAAFTTARQTAQKSQLDQLTAQMAIQKFPFEMQKLQSEADKAPYENMKLQAETGKLNQEADVATAVQKFLSGGNQDGGNLPPGTTMTAGGLTIPLNQKLTDTEQSSISGFDKFKPIAEKITSLIDGGVLGSGKNRTYTQILAEGGGDVVRRILTKDNTPLEELASAASEIKKYAFSEGGKQLSPTELKVVMAGLSFVGKSDNQAKTDFNEAIRILASKKKLALGGAVSAKTGSQTQDLSTMSTEELKKLAGL